MNFVANSTASLKEQVSSPLFVHPYFWLDIIPRIKPITEPLNIFSQLCVLHFQFPL